MELLQLENVQVYKDAADWRDAIRKSAKPLEEHGYVEPRYKDEIIKNVEDMGAYIVIAENIALPHARPEQGVLRTQIGVALFQNPVAFDNGAKAQLFITLAAENSDSHLEALVQISELLSDEENVKKILASKSSEELYHYF